MKTEILEKKQTLLAHWTSVSSEDEIKDLGCFSDFAYLTSDSEEPRALIQNLEQQINTSTELTALQKDHRLLLEGERQRADRHQEEMAKLERLRVRYSEIEREKDQLRSKLRQSRRRQVEHGAQLQAASSNPPPFIR